MASDPKVAFSNVDNHPRRPSEEDAQNAAKKVEADSILTRADSADSAATDTIAPASPRTSQSRASSQTLNSQLSGGSSSTSKATKQRISIVDMRVQAQAAIRGDDGGPIEIKHADELARTMPPTLLMGIKGIGDGMDRLDVGSDDSDGPPSDWEDGEERIAKEVLI